MKVLEENLGVNLYDLGNGDGFLDMIPKAEENKENIDSLNLYLCVLQEYH